RFLDGVEGLDGALIEFDEDLSAETLEATPYLLQHRSSAPYHDVRQHQFIMNPAPVLDGKRRIGRARCFGEESGRARNLDLARVAAGFSQSDFELAAFDGYLAFILLAGFFFFNGGGSVRVARLHGFGGMLRVVARALRKGIGGGRTKRDADVHIGSVF